jgi:hypothetical protein
MKEVEAKVFEARAGKSRRKGLGKTRTFLKSSARSEINP